MVKEQSISFREYLRNSKLLQFGFAFQIFSLVVVIAVFLFLSLTDNDTNVYMMDYQVFYESGQAFLSSPDSIYLVNPNGLPFRYFPAFAAFMSLFSAIPMVPLYLINIVIMTILHLFVVFLAFRLCIQLGLPLSTKNFEKTLTILAIMPPHVVNLILGQISQLVILLVLMALLLLYTASRNSYLPFLMVGILFGIASTFKPFCLVLVPFLLPFSLSGRFRLSISVKQFIGVILGLLFSMLPSLLYFLAYPSTINEFIQVNMTSSLASHHSTSITKLLTSLFPIFDSPLFEISLVVFLGGILFLRSYLQFIKEPADDKNYVHHFTNMMFLVLLVYPESWFLFLAYLYAFLAPSMINLYGMNSFTAAESRRLDLLWNGTNNLLAFFSIGIVLHYLMLGFDPVNPIWILILYILYNQLSSFTRIYKTSGLMC